MPTHARFQSTLDKSKSLQQYNDLRRAGKVAKAVVIAELKDGSYHVLGQNLTPEEMAPMLVVAADALTHAEANRRLVKLIAHQEPVQRGEWNRGKPMTKKIKTDANGNLVPPPGENFISCGECNHPLWHVLHHNADHTQSRVACSHCGNEVVTITVWAEGHG
jgi:hypothetical protein